MLLPTQDTLQLCSLIAGEKTGRDGHGQQVWKAQVGEWKKLVHWEGNTDPEKSYKQGAGKHLFLEVFRTPLDIDMAALTDGQYFLSNLFPP